MKKFLSILFAVILGILAIMPMASAASNTLYVNSANGRTVRVHKTDDQGNVICSLGVGFPVTVIGASNNGYTEISFKLNGKSYTGWMQDQYLQYNDPSTRKQTFKSCDNPFVVTVRPSSANGRVNLWPSASKKGDELRTLNHGEQLTVIAYSHAWYKVIDSQGNTGYVAKAYVKKL